MQKLSAEEKRRRELEKEERRIRRGQERKEREERKKAEAEEKERKRQAAEEERERKRCQLEEIKKEKEIKRLAIEKEREERRREKEQERKEKEERRLIAEAEKRAKLDEKQRREEEKLKKLEEKRQAEEKEAEKKKRESALFTSYFRKNSCDSLNCTSKSLPDEESLNGPTLFKPFQLQPFQTLANIIPPEKKISFNKEVFESTLEESRSTIVDKLYVDELRGRKILKQKRSKHPRCYQPPSDVILEDDSTQKMVYRVKFLFFHTDVRPPYHGTWRKKSKFVNGRRPLAKDSSILNYEVDSEEEWEEEEPGESIADSNSEGSVDGDDFEMDDFCVPHGHLSDEEELVDEDDEQDRENRKKRHQPLLKESDLLKERKKISSKKVNPVGIGCYWRGLNTNAGDNEIRDHFNLLSQYQAVFFGSE